MMINIVDDKENDKLVVNSILNISPIRTIKSPFRDSSESNILICSKFQESLFLDFGHVALKATKQLKFAMKNPSKKAVKVAIDERFTEKSGLQILLDSNGAKSVFIEPDSLKAGIIYWNPPTDCSLRAVVNLKLDDRAPLQIIVKGIAGTGIGKANDAINDQAQAKDNSRKQSKISSLGFASPERKQSKKSEKKITFLSPERNIAAEKRVSLMSPPVKLKHVLGSPPTVSLGDGRKRIPVKEKSKVSTLPCKSMTTSVVRRPQSSDISDSKWAEKQAANFTDWMNYTYDKAQQIHLASDCPEQLQEVEKAEYADSKEGAPEKHSGDDSQSQSQSISQRYASSFKQILQQRLDASLRQRALDLLKDEGFQASLRALDDEVEAGRLTMREDRDIHADLGQQELFFALLFSYELPWLKLGLETITGQVIAFNKPIQLQGSNTTLASSTGSIGKIKAVFKAFVMENIFSDKAILDHFGKHKLLYIAQERKLKEKLRRHMLKKVLSLVLFLDAAKTRSPPLLPKSSLFVKDSTVKSSKEALTYLCRCLLKGEGDIVRHLQLLGCSLSYVQSYVDEFDFSVRNLALDLRDGVRLVKLYELLTGSKSLTNQLRVPAVSRLQKLHNVSLILSAIYSADEARPQPKQIVDGHREGTLMLLWKLLYTFELRMLIQPARVAEEIKAIRRSKKWRRSVYSRDEAEQLSVKVLVYEDQEAEAGGQGQADRDVRATLHTCTADDVDGRGGLAPGDGEEDDFGESPQKARGGQKDDDQLSPLLLRWVRSICEQYQVPVFDFTTCLADGRALCLLIHYYHPTILPTRKIRKTTAHLIQKHLKGANSNSPSPRNKGRNGSGGSPRVLSSNSPRGPGNRAQRLSRSFSSSSLQQQQSQTPLQLQFSNADLQTALQGERKNFSLLRKACMDIGGIPLMLPEHYDSRNVPEEKTMFLFLGYLFARLIESAGQVSAAINIQKRFRDYLQRRRQRSHNHAQSSSSVSSVSSVAVHHHSPSSSLQWRITSEGHRAGEDDESDWASLLEPRPPSPITSSILESIHEGDIEDEDEQNSKEGTRLNTCAEPSPEVNPLVVRTENNNNPERDEGIEESDREEQNEIGLDDDDISEVSTSPYPNPTPPPSSSILPTQPNSDHSNLTSVSSASRVRLPMLICSPFDMVDYIVDSSCRRHEDYFGGDGDGQTIKSELDSHCMADQNRNAKQEDVRICLLDELVRDIMEKKDDHSSALLSPDNDIDNHEEEEGVQDDTGDNENNPFSLDSIYSVKDFFEFSASAEEREIEVIGHFAGIHISATDKAASHPSKPTPTLFSASKPETPIHSRSESPSPESASYVHLDSDGDEGDNDNQNDNNGQFSSVSEQEQDQKQTQQHEQEEIRVQIDSDCAESCELRHEQYVLETPDGTPPRSPRSPDSPRSACSSVERRVPFVCMGEYEEELVWMRRMAEEVKAREELEMRLFRESAARRHAEKVAQKAQDSNKLLQETIRKGLASAPSAQEEIFPIISPRHNHNQGHSTAPSTPYRSNDNATAAHNPSGRLLERTVRATLILSVEKEQQHREDQEAIRRATDRLHSEEEARLALEKRLQQLLASQPDLIQEREWRMMLQEDMLAERAARLRAETRLLELQQQRERQQSEARQIKLQEDLQQKHQMQKIQDLKIRTVSILQAHWRGKKQRKFFALFLQQKKNTEDASRKKKEDEARQAVAAAIEQSAALRITKSIRDFAIFKKTLKAQAAAANLDLERTNRAIIVLQRYARGFIARSGYRRNLAALILVQAQIRACVTRRLYLMQKAAVGTIQKIWKRALKAIGEARVLAANALSRRRAEKMLNGFARVIKKKLRQLSAVRMIQRWVRSRRPLLRVRKMLRGFRRLLAVRRARLIKRRVTCPKVVLLAERIKQSAQRAKTDPSLRLGRQTLAALQVLENANGRMISQVLRACQTLELSTQFSRLCCESFAEAGASNILFALLRSCNRSTPHQELLRISLVVLLHVGRHSTLAPLVAQSEDCCDVLVDLMQMFRDKKNIFILAAELLSRLIHASTFIKDVCNSPIYRKRLEGIQNIIERKMRLEAKVKTVGHPAPTPLLTISNTSASGGVPSPVSSSAGSGTGGSTSCSRSPSKDVFEMYRGRQYRTIEPMACVHHLMHLLQKS